MIDLIQNILNKEFGVKAAEITRMTKGICNEVYLVELPFRKVIVRLNKDPSEMSGSSKHLQVFKSLGVKVQEILASDYSKTFVPFAYQIRSYLEGKDIDLVIADLSEQELKGVAEEIAGIVRKLEKLPTNGKYGWVGNDEENLMETWPELMEKGIQEVEDRNQKTGAVGDKYIQLMKALIEEHHEYFANVPSIFYYDDMSSKNVLIHNGKFAGLVDLDTVAYGDPLEGIGRIKASWYGTPHGKIYSEAVMNALHLTKQDRKIVHVYALLNRISWLSESGIQFNQNTSSEVDWEKVKRDRKVIDAMIEELERMK